jgi:hypothetical protein
MFEDMAVSAAQLLIVTFWIALISLVFWGAWWLRSLRHVKG